MYGITPIEDLWVQGETSFFDLAEDFGYTREFVNGGWHWFANEELLATSNDEFFKHYFGEAVASYNEQELEKLGTQNEISAVLGRLNYGFTYGIIYYLCIMGLMIIPLLTGKKIMIGQSGMQGWCLVLA